MARTFLGSPAQYLQRSTAAATAAPMSMACWVNASSFSTSPVPMSVSGAAVPPSFDIQFSTSGANGTVCFEAWSASVDNEVVSSVNPVVSTWVHVCAVFTSTTLRAIYVNGGGKVTSATSVSPAAPSVTTIGAYGSGARPMTGVVAFPAYWNAALTDSEVLSLSKGASPIKIRPQSLRSYVRMTGGSSPEPDMVSSSTFALTSTPATAANPLIFFP